MERHKDMDAKKEDHCERPCNKLATSCSFIFGTGAKIAGWLSNDLVKCCAAWDNRCSIIGTQLVSQRLRAMTMAKQWATLNSAQTRAQHHANNRDADRNSPETHTWFFQRTEQWTMINRTEANDWETMNSTDNRMTMTILVVLAITLATHQENANWSRETMLASKTKMDKCMSSKVKMFEKTIKNKTQKTARTTFLMLHSCFRVSAIVTTTFISRMKDHIWGAWSSDKGIEIWSSNLKFLCLWCRSPTWAICFSWTPSLLRSSTIPDGVEQFSWCCRTLPPTSQVGSIQILLTKGTPKSD